MATCNSRALLDHAADAAPSGSAKQRSLVVPMTSAAANEGASSRAPRPIYPQSGATLLGSNVVFRWIGDQAHVELARERGFQSIVQRSPPSGASGQVLHLARGVWFWRVVDAKGDLSRVWSFDVTGHSPPQHSPNLLLGADYNCDGLADLSVQYGVVLGRFGKVIDNPVTALDIGALKVPELTRAADDQPFAWSLPESTGDVDGDGCGDMSAQVARQSSTRLEDDVPIRLFFKGSQDIHSSWAATSRSTHNVVRVGDLNDDGYADVAECWRQIDTHCSVYAGGPKGLHDQPLFDLPHYDRVLGGADLNGDDYTDLVGVSKDGLIAFYAGPLNTEPSAPTHTWHVLAPLSEFVELADLDGDGHIDIWGKGTIWRKSAGGVGDARLWMISGEDTANGKPARMLGSFRREVSDDMDFIPGVGERRTGVLVRSTDLRNDFAFVQEAFPFQLHPPTGFTPLIRSDFSETGLASIGDFNGDGWDDLLVTRTTDYETIASEVYLGGAKPFAVHRPTEPSDTDPLSGGFISGGPARFPFSR